MLALFCLKGIFQFMAEGGCRQAEHGILKRLENDAQILVKWGHFMIPEQMVYKDQAPGVCL